MSNRNQSRPIRTDHPGKDSADLFACPDNESKSSPDMEIFLTANTEPDEGTEENQSRGMPDEILQDSDELIRQYIERKKLQNRVLKGIIDKLNASGRELTGKSENNKNH